MRYIKPLFLFVFWLAVIFLPLAQAETSAFIPDVVVRKKVDESGKVTFSKSGFSDKKPVKKQPVVVEEVKVAPAIAVPKVEMYYAAWDPYSNKAIVFFRENHVVVNAYDIDLDPEAAARKKKIDPSFVGMPLVIINGVVIRGVDEKKYKEALLLALPSPQ